MSYVRYLSDVSFYGCILIAIAEHFGWVRLNEEQNQVFNFLLIFSGFVGLINITIWLVEGVTTLFHL